MLGPEKKLCAWYINLKLENDPDIYFYINFKPAYYCA
jgi:hypothetical protein